MLARMADDLRRVADAIDALQPCFDLPFLSRHGQGFILCPDPHTIYALNYSRGLAMLTAMLGEPPRDWPCAELAAAAGCRPRVASMVYEAEIDEQAMREYRNELRRLESAPSTPQTHEAAQWLRCMVHDGQRRSHGRDVEHQRIAVYQALRRAVDTIRDVAGDAVARRIVLHTGEICRAMLSSP